MEYPTFKEFSQNSDQFREEENKPPRWIITKVILWLLTLWIMTTVFAIFFNMAERQRMEKKYKKVIKKNWLGFTSEEWHERD